ncbi:MAG: FkbM family methyltransferase [Saprospiraceae bacterium]|nr:FkbM family methyltransferase [Saprospiraceae bacterium]
MKPCIFPAEMEDHTGLQTEKLKNRLIRRLADLDRRAKAGKWTRLLLHPGRYLLAMIWQYLAFPLCRIGLPITRKTFYDRRLKVLLPAGTDIYLLGGKSHDSEIRLARYLIETLSSGDRFLDIGAHYGYFSALASRLVGPEGKIMAIEATPQTFAVLKANLSRLHTAKALPLALAEEVGEMTFFTFPVRYSEYNTLDVTPYEEEDWYADYPPVEVRIQTTTFDQIIPEYKPHLIKIDVEGAENRVIKGGMQALAAYHTPIVMEYLDAATSGGGHQEADALLRSLGYQPHVIDAHGKISPTEAIETYLMESGLSSDNLVYLFQS